MITFLGFLSNPNFFSFFFSSVQTELFRTCVREKISFLQFKHICLQLICQAIIFSTRFHVSYLQNRFVTNEIGLAIHFILYWCAQINYNIAKISSLPDIAQFRHTPSLKWCNFGYITGVCKDSEECENTGVHCSIIHKHQNWHAQRFDQMFTHTS